MKIIIKTLAKTEFPIECEETDTVLSVKQKIEETKANTDQEMPAASQKLIALGKIMEDGKALSEYNIKDGGFLVVMVTKPKKPKKAKEETKAPEPAPAATTAPVASTEAQPAASGDAPS